VGLRLTQNVEGSSSSQTKKAFDESAAVSRAPDGVPPPLAAEGAWNAY
jgi:hypothetical protein